MRAGLLPRLAALIIDLLVAAVPAMLISFLPGVLFPLDAYLWASMVLMLPAVVVCLAYIFFGYAALPNTYGRYVVGVRVRSAATGTQPSYGQAFVRALTVGLWPIDGLILLFSESKQRLGDRLANTVVEWYAPEEVWWRRAVPGALGVGIGYGLLLVLTPVVMGRMEISRAARDYAAQELPRRTRGTPKQITILNDTGQVALSFSGNEHIRVHLLRSGERWQVQRVEPVSGEEVGGGFSVQQGGMSVVSR